MRRKSKSEETTGLKPLWVGPNNKKQKVEGYQTLLFTGGLIHTPWAGEASGIHPNDPPAFDPYKSPQTAENVF